MGSDPRGSRQLHGILETPPQFTPEQILEDAVYVAAPWMSREEARAFVTKPKEKPQMSSSEQELLRYACNVRDRFVTRRVSRGTNLLLPEITSLRLYRQGNYTVVVLNGEVVGVSKRMKKDKTNPTTGVNKAIYRAVRRLVTASQR